MPGVGRADEFLVCNGATDAGQRASQGRVRQSFGEPLNARDLPASKGGTVNFSTSASRQRRDVAGRLAVVSLLSCMVKVHAQDPFAPWLRYNLGKVVILPRAEVATSYTDNLFNMSGSGRVADGITSVTPGLKLKWDENAVADASLDYRHGETLIWDNSAFNSSSDNVDARVSYTAAKWRATGTGSFSESKALQPGSLNQGRNLLGTTRLQGSANAWYDWTPKSDLSAAVNYQSLDYDSRYLSDQEQVEGRLGAAYEITTRLRWTVDAKVGHTRVMFNQVTRPAVSSVFYGGLLGLRGSFTEKLKGALRLGYEGRQFDSGRSFSASTPAVGLDLTYQASVLTQMALTYDRSTSVGAWQGGQLTINDSVGLRVTHALGITGRWVVSGNGRMSFGDYQWDRSAFPPGYPDVSRTDTSFGVDLAVQYRPQPWLTCAGGYSLDRYILNFNDPFVSQFFLARSYLANRVFVSVAVGF